MKLEVNINKKVACFILGVMFLLAGGFVYAYGTSNATTFGHSAGEIDVGGLISNDCTWVGGSRCNGCRYNWYCPEGSVATGVAQRSTGETHLDYVWVYCCKLG
jgi:hypothetical protein